MTHLLPSPRTISAGQGSLALPNPLTICAPPGAEALLRPWTRQLEDGCGLTVRYTDQPALVTVTLDGSASATTATNGQFPGEQYSLEISDSISLSGTAAGLARAAQTLRQLLPVASLRPGGGAPAELPRCVIEDSPHYGWRGLHIDVARHFLPIARLRELVDIAAFHKLSVLHLHLTDDQGWRMPIDAFPRLTEVGGFRRETQVGRPKDMTFDGKPHGGFYHKDELRALVSYAAERAITVVPEIDLPGHFVAAITAYPEWGNRPVQREVLTRWGVSTHILNTEESTMDALRQILTEVAEVFPGPWIHLGGDEVPTAEWEASPRAQDFVAQQGLGGTKEIQGWIMNQMSEHLRSLGRIPVGWDEVLDTNPPADLVAMAWRGTEPTRKALRSGHPTVVSDHSAYYLDFQSSMDPDEPIGQYFAGTPLSLTDVANYQPPVGEAEPLGVQVQLWTEYVPTWERLQYQLLPRLAAFAQVAWGGPGSGSGLADTVSEQLRRYDALGWDYRPLDGPGPRWSIRWHGPVAEEAATMHVGAL